MVHALLVAARLGGAHVVVRIQQAYLHCQNWVRDTCEFLCPPLSVFGPSLLGCFSRGPNISLLCTEK